MEPAPMPAAADAVVAEEEEEAPGLTWSAFADASYTYQTAHSTTPVASHRAYAGNSGDGTANSGFALQWLGLDVGYDAGEFAATGSLRFGSAVPVYYAANQTDIGIENVTQLYATWRPTETLTLDFGQFGTIYGAEVAESWNNLNYTRGGLYYLMQPFWHTGLRANYSISEEFGVTALVVNGVNNLVDDNDTPSIGLQLAYGTDTFSAALGYLGAIEPSTDGSGFHNFIDLVVTASLDQLSIVFNADLNVSDQDIVFDGAGFERTIDTPAFFGLSLAAGYEISPIVGVAVRGEYLGDANNTLYVAQDGLASSVGVTTLTGTLDLKPVEGSDNFILRWDNRLEMANEDVFFNKDSRPSDQWFASVVGAVITTN
jgi:hypothetical protein